MKGGKEGALGHGSNDKEGRVGGGGGGGGGGGSPVRRMHFVSPQ